MARPQLRHRTGLAVAISALVHAALLITLSRVVPLGPEPRLPVEPDMQIDLVTTKGEAVEGLSTSRTTHLTRAPRVTVPPLPAGLDRRKPAPINRPASATAKPAASSPVHPSAAPTQAGGAATSAPPPALRAGGAQPRPFAAGSGEQAAEAADGTGMRSMLRTTVGCSHVDYLRLTLAERAVCARQFGRQASIGGRQTVDPISMKKRDYFDAVRQAYDGLHNYSTPLDDDPEHSASGPGHGPSIGCIHGKCGVISPQGTLMEEAGISPP